MKVPAQRGRGGSLTPHGHQTTVQTACHPTLDEKPGISHGVLPAAVQL